MTDKTFVLLGGGELKSKTTLKIDEYVANLIKSRTDKRPYGLFIGTASHDSMPYFNSFRKTYTGQFDIKADCALTVYGEMDHEKISGKFDKADFIYIGGGDTLFMLDSWKRSGLYDLVLNAYDKGVVIVGLSAGAICFFEDMYTDSVSVCGDDKYRFQKGIGILKGACCPHYEIRCADFDPAFINSTLNFAYAIEGDSAIVFKNETLLGSLSSGGKSYYLQKDGKNLIKNVINEIKSEGGL